MGKRLAPRGAVREEDYDRRSTIESDDGEHVHVIFYQCVSLIEEKRGALHGVGVVSATWV